MEPSEEVGVALVSETVCTAACPFGSLAGTRPAGVEYEARRRPGMTRAVVRVRRVRDSIMGCVGQATCYRFVEELAEVCRPELRSFMPRFG
jgi:hypothetical protein